MLGGLIHPPEPGLYRIANQLTGKDIAAADSGIEKGATVEGHPYKGQSNQLWELRSLSSGDFQVRPFHAQTVLDLARSRKEDDAPIGVYASSNTSNQQWRIEPQREGSVKIRSVCSSKLLSIHSRLGIVQRAEDGKPDQLWELKWIGSRLNQDWFMTTVGETNPADKAELKSEQFVLTDQGSDIHNPKDNTAFVIRDAQGDFDLVARMVGVDGNLSETKAGLMIRETLLPAASNVLIETADGAMFQQRRPTSGARTTYSKLPQPQRFPCWLKLERRGDQITGYLSADGKTWIQACNDTVKMAPHVFIGPVVCSRNADKKAIVAFDNLTYTPK
jgi:regulation of enolase protein 1 (concanavalin A-like superfamily)